MSVLNPLGKRFGAAAAFLSVRQALVVRKKLGNRLGGRAS